MATARAALKDGLALREQGNLDAAAGRMQTAWDLVKTPVTAFELGKTEMMRGRILTAHELFQAVVRMPTTLEESQRSVSAREESARLGTELEPRIPQLRLHVKLPAGASAVVHVDDDEVTLSGDTATRLVDPGKHEVTAKAGDGPEQKVMVSIAESEAKDVDLAPQWIPPKPKPKEGGREVYVHQTNPLVFIGFGVAGASLVLTGVATPIAINATKDAQQHCGQVACGQHARDTYYGPSVFWTVVAVGSGIATLGFGVMAAISIGNPVVQKVSTSEVRPYVGLGSAGVEGRF